MELGLGHGIGFGDGWTYRYTCFRREREEPGPTQSAGFLANLENFRTILDLIVSG